jgi:hypothetical protein
MLLYGAGAFVEGVLGATLASSLLYLPGALSVPINAVIVTAWAGLRLLPPPL